MKLGGNTAQDPQGHSTKFVLVDQVGNIKGYYDSMSEESLTKLETDVLHLTAYPTT